MALCVASALVVVLAAMASDGRLIIGLLVLTPVIAASILICLLLDRNAGFGMAAIFLTALAVRWLVAIGVDRLIYTSMPGLFAPDEILYEINGWKWSLFLRGAIPDPNNGDYQWLHVWMIGLIYEYIGRVPLIPKLCIGIYGAWTAALGGLIAYRVWPQAARRAGFLCALWPSLVLWSALLTRDTLCLLGVELAIVGALYLRDRISLLPALSAALGLTIVLYDRPYEVAFVGLGVAASFILASNRNNIRNVILFAIFAFVVIYLIRKNNATSMVDATDQEDFLQKVNAIREGYTTGANSAMRIDLVDTRSFMGLAAWIPIGLLYFWFAPLPFTGGSIISLSTSPEMIAWYLLLPALVRSIRMGFRQRLGSFRTLFFYALAASVGWGIMVTNVGSCYRYRAQMLFVPLILIAADQTRKRIGDLTPASGAA
jgi:hypothetical protein